MSLSSIFSGGNMDREKVDRKLDKWESNPNARVVYATFEGTDGSTSTAFGKLNERTGQVDKYIVPYKDGYREVDQGGFANWTRGYSLDQPTPNLGPLVYAGHHGDEPQRYMRRDSYSTGWNDLHRASPASAVAANHTAAPATVAPIATVQPAAAQSNPPTMNMNVDQLIEHFTGQKPGQDSGEQPTRAVSRDRVPVRPTELTTRSAPSQEAADRSAIDKYMKELGLEAIDWAAGENARPRNSHPTSGQAEPRELPAYVNARSWVSDLVDHRGRVMRADSGSGEPALLVGVDKNGKVVGGLVRDPHDETKGTVFTGAELEEKLRGTGHSINSIERDAQTRLAQDAAGLQHSVATPQPAVTHSNGM